MATANMYPNADGSTSGVIGGFPSVPPYYAVVDEGVDSPSVDDDSIFFSSNGAYVFLAMTDTPSDCSAVTAVTVRLREADSSKGRTIASCQIFQSDESTALTSSMTVTGSTTATTYSFNPTITGSTSKTAWDGAKIKVIAGGSSGSSTLYAVEFNITYTQSSGSTNTAAILSLI